MKNIQVELLIDKRNIRWFQILNILERTSEISRKDLADSLKITTRTVTSDIREIKEYFKHSLIIQNDSRGYIIEISNKLLYQEKKIELLSHEPLLTLLSEIFHGATFSTGEWADKFFIAERTLESYLKRLHPLLNRFQLKLTSPILDIVGKEVDIRNFYLSIFYKDDAIPHYVFPPILIQTLIQQLPINHFDKWNLNVPYFKLSYLLMITQQRMQKNYSIQLPQSVITSLCEPRFLSAMEPVKILFKKYTELDMDLHEICYILLMVLDHQAFHDNFEKTFDFSKFLPNSLNIAINEFCKQQELNQSDTLVEYVESFFYLNFLKASTSITLILMPSSLHDYVKNFPENLEISKLFLLNFPNNFWFEAIDDFSISVYYFIESLRYRTIKKNYVLAFVFEGPAESCLLIESIAKYHIPSNHTVYFFHATTFSKTSLEQYSIDIVITNFSEYLFTDSEFNDYILFNFIPTVEDWNTLLSRIEPRLSSRFKLSVR